MHLEKVSIFSCCKGSSLVHVQHEEHEMAGGSFHAKSSTLNGIKKLMFSELSSAVSIVNRMLSRHLVYFPQFELQPCYHYNSFSVPMTVYSVAVKSGSSR